MRIHFIAILYLFSLSICFAQNDDPLDLPIDSTTSKWPYFGKGIPPYIAILGGYEGLKTNNFEVGLGVSPIHTTVDPPVGAFFGPVLIYKQSFTTNKIHSYEAELGIYGGIVFGVNYNYNVTTTNKIHGFKPFIGMAFYNFHLFYGYSFYNDNDDLNNELRHNRITLRYIIPVIKLGE